MMMMMMKRLWSNLLLNLLNRLIDSPSKDSLRWCIAEARLVL
jgi:hypothetical protein